MNQQIIDLQNILKVHRTSDQSVRLGFASCRAASAFEKSVVAKLEDKSTGLTCLNRLLKACDAIRDDLLFRADIDLDGTRAVNVSDSIWSEFNDAMDLAMLEVSADE